jgi:hypothetical protein
MGVEPCKNNADAGEKVRRNIKKDILSCTKKVEREGMRADST